MLLLLFLCLGSGCGVLGVDEKITSASGLISFATNVLSGSTYEGTTVYLENDIDFTEELSSQFKPIGDSSHPFRGTFDGQGHKISNLKLSSSSFRHAGLFGYSTGTTIRNVVVDSSCYFASSYPGKTGYRTFAGGIIGCCDAIDGSCIFENNVNMGAVSTLPGAWGEEVFLGGISGQVYSKNTGNNIMIRDCVNYGVVTSSGTSNNFTEIGGIVGELVGSGATKYVYNCINYGH